MFLLFVYLNMFLIEIFWLKVLYTLQVFHEADEGNKGFLTREDVKVAIAELLGYKPSKV